MLLILNPVSKIWFALLFFLPHLSLGSLPGFEALPHFSPSSSPSPSPSPSALAEAFGPEPDAAMANYSVLDPNYRAEDEVDAFIRQEEAPSSSEPGMKVELILGGLVCVCVVALMVGLFYQKKEEKYQSMGKKERYDYEAP